MIDEYTKTLQNYLQSRITIKCNNKILKSGKLTLFNIKQYFIRFYIETDKKTQKIIELPYPFKLEYTDASLCTLNYKLTSLCNNHTQTVGMLKTINKNTSHKIYDSVVTITAQN